MGDFPLKLDPSERIVFSSEKLGEEEVKVLLKLNNTSADKLCWKLKCTSNELFRIRPVTGLLKSKDEVVVSLFFCGGKSVPESGKHYFAIYTIKATDDKNAREQWSAYKGQPQGQKKLPVDFKKQVDMPEAAADKKDADEKDEDKKESKKEEKKVAEDKKAKDKADVKVDVKIAAKVGDEKKEEKEAKDEEKKDEKKDGSKKEAEKDDDKKEE
ncbi:Major sperm protein [Aphelenchoides besseyi]|nr:Major sperm protein [Aphelenchoides besseyi]